MKELTYVNYCVVWGELISWTDSPLVFNLIDTTSGDIARIAIADREYNYHFTTSPSCFSRHFCEIIQHFDSIWSTTRWRFIKFAIIMMTTHLAGLWYSQRNSQRSSGTGTLFSLGSIVQKGKFSAGAALLVRTLKNVDFPTKLKSGK